VRASPIPAAGISEDGGGRRGERETGKKRERRGWAAVCVVGWGSG